MMKTKDSFLKQYFTNPYIPTGNVRDSRTKVKLNYLSNIRKNTLIPLCRSLYQSLQL